MFAMYDDDGLNFRSTLDHLYDIHKIEYSQKLKSNIKDHHDTQEQFKENLKKSKSTQEAKDKYTQMENIEEKSTIYHIDQIMSHTAIIISDEKTIIDCLEIMKDKHIQQLLLRKDTQNHLKGMITKHDILNFLVENINDNSKINNLPISEISIKKIITTDPKSDIRRVAKVMIDFNLNAIPVVDKNDIILGVVSRHDIVKAVASIPHLQVWA
jgi:CBS domain-containing protein